MNTSDALRSGLPARLTSSETADLARVLAEYWVEQMLATFELRAARPPRLWPGRTTEAQRLASAYAEVPEDCERLADLMQELAQAGWPVRAAAAGASSRPPPVVGSNEADPSVATTPRVDVPYAHLMRDRDSIRDSLGEIEVDLGEL